MMLAAGIPAVGGVAYGVYSKYRGTSDPHDDEAELVEKTDADSAYTWKQSAGRTEGKDGYVFGDLTRGAIGYLKGGRAAVAKEDSEEKAVELAGDEQYTQVQRLVADAVQVYRARGYAGSITVSQNIAYFTESCTVRVEAPEGDVPPWLRLPTSVGGDDADAANAVAALPDAAHVENAAMASGKSRAGMVFGTLLARLERRAYSWEAMSGMEGVDPSLTSAAQIGFALPVIRLGWGLSVNLSISQSSLLRWAEFARVTMEAEEARAKEEEAAAAVKEAMANVAEGAKEADEKQEAAAEGPPSAS